MIKIAYGYFSNEKFIEASQKLLNKLEKAKLWNKDTLVVI